LAQAVPLIPTTATSTVMVRTGLKPRSSFLNVVRTELPFCSLPAARGTRWIGLPLRLCSSQPRVHPASTEGLGT
jgi:hypothetical protein